MPRLRRALTQAPNFLCRIEPSHPLAEKCVFFIYAVGATLYDAVNQLLATPTVVSGSPIVAPYYGGPSASITTTGAFYTFPDHPNHNPIGDFTLFWRGMFVSFAGNRNIASKVPGSGSGSANSPFDTYAAATTGVVNVVRSNAVGFRGFSSGAIACTANAVNDVAITMPGSIQTGGSIYINNSVNNALTNTGGSGTGAPTVTATGLSVGRRPDAATQMNGNVELLIGFSTLLSAAEIAYLRQNPWALLAIPRPQALLSGAFAAAMSEAASSSDTVTSATSASVSITEAATSSDAILAAIIAAVSMGESITVVDAAAAATSASVTRSDAAAASESVSTTMSAAPSAADAASAADSISATMSAAASASDAAAASDSVSVGSALSSSGSDAASATDSATSSFTASTATSELVTSSDLVVASYTAIAAAADAVSLAESISGAFGLLSASRIEAVAASDTVTTSFSVGVVATASVIITDVVASSLPGGLIGGPKYIITSDARLFNVEAEGRIFVSELSRSFDITAGGRGFSVNATGRKWILS